MSFKSTHDACCNMYVGIARANGQGIPKRLRRAICFACAMVICFTGCARVLERLVFGRIFVKTLLTESVLPSNFGTQKGAESGLKIKTQKCEGALCPFTRCGPVFGIENGSKNGAHGSHRLHCNQNRVATCFLAGRHSPHVVICNCLTSLRTGDG